MSKLFSFEVKTSGDHIKPVMVTVMRTKNDYSGNPMYKVQVWAIHKDTNLSLDSIGNVWAPNVKGYRRNKDDQYSLQSYNVEMDIQHFMKAFEKAVQA